MASIQQIVGIWSKNRKDGPSSNADDVVYSVCLIELMRESNLIRSVEMNVVGFCERTNNRGNGYTIRTCIPSHIVEIVDLNGTKTIYHCDRTDEQQPNVVSRTYYATMDEMEVGLLTPEGGDGDYVMTVDNKRVWQNTLDALECVNDLSILRAIPFTDQGAMYKSFKKACSAEVQLVLRQLAGVLINEGKIALPHTMIDGVRVSCDLLHERGTDLVSLRVRNSFIQRSDRKSVITTISHKLGGLFVPTYEVMANTIASIVAPAIAKMTYDKVNGFLVGVEPWDEPLAMEDCCVCMETTSQKTLCGHTCCLQCMGSLELQAVGDSGHSATCPLCRASLVVF